MANYQELANLVWNVADDVLRELFKPHKYGDITLPFLVLRRAGTPRSSDGALLFLQHMLSKIEDRGSRVGIVFNGSTLFTGMPAAVKAKSENGLSKTIGWSVLSHCLKSRSLTPVSPPIFGF